MRAWAAALLIAMLLSGCAKFPSTGGQAEGTRLIFSFMMDGAVDPNKVYVVALNPSTEESPTTQGPIPVIAPPWGNGMVEGNVTHFVRWNAAQSPRYLIFQFTNTDLIDYFERGVPINFLEVEPGGREIRFEIELRQIAATDAEAATFRTLQVNFLTMDNIPQGNSGDKSWDALGDGRLPNEINTWINIPLRTTGVYDNRHFQNLEPQGDNPDPSLDIEEFSVEVRL